MPRWGSIVRNSLELRSRVEATKSSARYDSTLAFVLLLGMLACTAAEEDARTSWAQRDSAGIEIIESLAPTWHGSGPWSVGLPPLVDLAVAGEGPMHQFYRITDATFGPGGTVVVANSGTGEVRFYESSGRFLASVGRAGDGPGEFRRLSSVQVYTPDSVVAFDYWQGRATVLGPTGMLGRTITLTVLNGAAPQQIHVASDSELVVILTDIELEGPRTGFARVPQTALSATHEGQITHEIGRLKGFETYLIPGGDVAPPFRRASHAAVANGSLFVCDGEVVEYRVLTLEGRLRQIARVPDYPLGIPRERLDSLRSAIGMGPSFARRMAAELPLAYPSCSSLIVDPLGFVWIEKYHPDTPAGQPRVWLVFSSEGVWLGEIALPAAFELYEVTQSLLLGRARDELGVESVQVFALHRGEGV